jgi:hypothetical protein
MQCNIEQEKPLEVASNWIFWYGETHYNGLHNVESQRFRSQSYGIEVLGQFAYSMVCERSRSH